MATNSKESDFYLGFQSLRFRGNHSKWLMNHTLLINHVGVPRFFWENKGGVALNFKWFINALVNKKTTAKKKTNIKQLEKQGQILYKGRKMVM